MSRILNHGENTQKYAHLTKQGEARKSGKKPPWDDPAWQKRIREAKQRVAEHEQQLRFDE
jgi:hypothetical protein